VVADPDLVKVDAVLKVRGAGFVSMRATASHDSKAPRRRNVGN